MGLEKAAERPLRSLLKAFERLLKCQDFKRTLKAF
jgi:hypothetical protein